MALTREERSSILLTNIQQKDCGVIALQAITGLPRAAALDAALEGGWTEDGGMPRGGMEKALRYLGYTCQPQPYDRTDTVATFALTHEYGMYLLYCTSPRQKGHVMALVEGDLHNARGSWGNPLDGATCVTR